MLRRLQLCLKFQMVASMPIFRSSGLISCFSIHGELHLDHLPQAAKPASNANFIIRGIINTFGAYQEYYQTSMLADKSPSAISWIGTLQGFLLFLVGIITGPVFDRGYCRALIIVGTLLVFLGMMTTSVAKTYSQLIFAQGVCVGLGSGCLFLPSIAIVATYFTTKRALMTGITAAGGSIGMLTFRSFSLPFLTLRS